MLDSDLAAKTMPTRLTISRYSILAFGLFLLAADVPAADLDVVELDVASGIVSARLPFDVPFVVVGQAPPGTTRVEVVYEIRRGHAADFAASEPTPPLRSGVDTAGRFRLSLPALPPNRQLRFRITFERRLGSAGALRAEIADALGRGLPEDGNEWRRARKPPCARCSSPGTNWP